MKKRVSPEKSKNHWTPKLAEIVTLSLSLVIIVGLYGYIALRAFNGRQHDTLEFSFAPALEQTKKVANGFVLPVDIKNEAGTTATKARFLFKAKGTEGDFELEYFGERAIKRVFLVLAEDPRTSPVEVRPIYYETE